MDVDAAADELYGLLPGQFTARRTELVAEARAAGDAQARTAIGNLRRPTTAAWLVNVLVRTHPRDVDRLFGLAAELRSAQRNLAGAELRELTAQRRTEIARLGELARSAAADAGQPAGDEPLREVQATLEAAVADENAEAAVRSGRLTTSLSYSGFGEVDLTDAVAAAPTERPRLTVARPADEGTAARAEPADRRAAERQQKREAAATRLADARRVASERSRAADAAQTALDKATKRRDKLAAELAKLQDELSRVQRDLRAADTDIRAGKHDHEMARRAADRAADQVSRAERERE